MRFLVGFCQWCHRVGVLLAIAGLVLAGRALAARPQGPAVSVQDTGGLWAQLVTAGVVLAVGVAVIRMFFTFKDAATRQAEDDRRANHRALQEAKDALLARTDEDKDELARELGKIGGNVQELNHALKGVGGYGGLLSAMLTHERRRHDLNNQMAALLLLMQHMVRVVGEVSGRLGVKFDQAEVQSDLNDLKRKNDALRNGER